MRGAIQSAARQPALQAHVKLRHDADASVSRIGHERRNVSLQTGQGIGQVRKKEDFEYKLKDPVQVSSQAWRHRVPTSQQNPPVNSSPQERQTGHWSG
jgi:hypothetical protein